MDGAKQPLSIEKLRAEFKTRLEAKFEAEEVKRVSLHSFRVYLACALLELKRSHSEIQALLRWKSEEALRIYARMSAATYADLLTGVGETEFEQRRTQNLPVQIDIGSRADAMQADAAKLRKEAEKSDARARSADVDSADSGAEDEE